jgi:hypothetical protein
MACAGMRSSSDMAGNRHAYRHRGVGVVAEHPVDAKIEEAGVLRWGVPGRAFVGGVVRVARSEVGGKAFLSRNVYGCTSKPAACASSTRLVAGCNASASLRGRIWFLLGPMPWA